MLTTLESKFEPFAKVYWISPKLDLWKEFHERCEGRYRFIYDDMYTLECAEHHMGLIAPALRHLFRIIEREPGHIHLYSDREGYKEEWDGP